MANTIKCPNCHIDIEVTETLTHQLRDELEQQLATETAKQQQELLAQRQLLAESQQKLVQQKQSLEEELQKRLQQEKQGLWKQALAKAQEQSNVELADLRNQAKENAEKLAAAQEVELKLRKQSRELEEQKRNLDLELQRKLDLERAKIVEQTKRDSSEEQRMKMLEKDKQLDIMRRQIEDLRRQSEQGSMQIQGEVQEADLKQLLKNAFAYDDIQDVPTGVNGADLIHCVQTNHGLKCGVIIWESKNTKTWSNDWIKKLKQDQSAVKADLCVLVSRALPDGLSSFGFIEGVWVVEYKYVLPLTQILRHNLQQIQQVKTTLVDRGEKIEHLYEYIASPQFKNKIENIVLAFSSMQSDLDTEKRSMQRIWSKREKEIERVILNTANMYGDLQGIIGTALANLPSLDLQDGPVLELE